MKPINPSSSANLDVIGVTKTAYYTRISHLDHIKKTHAIFKRSDFLCVIN